MTRTPAPFLHSLHVQVRVVHALVLREALTRFGRHNLGFLWLFLEPMMFTIGVAWLWSLLKASSRSPIPIVAFAITGYSAVLLWRSMPGRCINAIEPNRALMHHRNVRLMDLYAARMLLEIAGVTASLCLLTVVFAALEMMSFPEDIPRVAAAWALLAWFGCAFGLCIAGLATRSDVIEKLWQPLSYLLFPLSGAAFMVEWLPPGVRSYALILPMVHCTEMLRDGYFGTVLRTHYDPLYVIAVNMGLSLLGLAMMRVNARRLLPE